MGVFIHMYYVNALPGKFNASLTQDLLYLISVFLSPLPPLFPRWRTFGDKSAPQILTIYP